MSDRREPHRKANEESLAAFLLFLSVVLLGAFLMLSLYWNLMLYWSVA
jgi:hypothetical protein